MSTAPSEFKRGWPLLVGCFLGIAIGVSSLYFYSLGIFIKPMAAEFGWSRGSASLGAFVGTAAAALMAIPTGRLVDRLGSVPVAMGSLLLLAIGFAALGLATTNLTSFLVLSALLSLLTAGSSPLSFTRLVVATFDRQRGLALGFVLAGTGAGAIIIPRTLAPYIATHGWRAGYLAMAAVIAVTFLPLWGFLARANRAPVKRTPPMPLALLVGNPATRLLGGIFFLAAVAILGTVVQFVPMLSDWGMTPANAGATASLIGVAAIAGRLIAGALLDKLPPHQVTAALFAIAATGIALLGWGRVAVASGGALVIGFAVGAEVDLIAFLVGRFFLKPVYGQVYGAIYATFLIGGSIGPVLSGYLHDQSGDYRLSLFVMAALLAFAATLSGRISRLPIPTTAGV
jgi:MFS family permease